MKPGDLARLCTDPPGHRRTVRRVTYSRVLFKRTRQGERWYPVSGMQGRVKDVYYVTDEIDQTMTMIVYIVLV